VDANKSLYFAWQFASGVFFGLSQLTVLQRFQDQKYPWYDIFFDPQWRAFILAATLVPVLLLVKKKLLERERATLVVLGRPPKHIIGDFMFSCGTVSLFAMFNYMVANHILLYTSEIDFSREFYVVVINVGFIAIGYHLLRKCAKIERERAEMNPDRGGTART
jgi:cbb3-type cytochrome oxidase subunit 3